jgi:hypothetical protein
MRLGNHYRPNERQLDIDYRRSIAYSMVETEVPALRQHVTAIADSARLRVQRQLACAVFYFIESAGEALLNKVWRTRV